MPGTFGSIKRNAVDSVSGGGILAASMSTGHVILDVSAGTEGQYITTDGNSVYWDDFPETLHIERSVGVTGSDGQVTFNWPLDAFSSPPVVTLAIQGSNAFRSCRIAAFTYRYMTT